MNCTLASFRGYLLLLSICILLLTGCRSEPETASSTPMPASNPVTSQRAATPTPQPVRPVTAAFLENTADGLTPIALAVPEIEMDVAISPMEWRVSEVNGVRTTVWVLPEAGAGWHPNSALPGTNGNVVISGHQLFGDAAFVPLALGDVEVGQEILLRTAGGQTFVYRVATISEPLPITRDLAQEQAVAAQYAAQTNEAQLTLIAGWPDYSSTHRIVVTATLAGIAE
jgi:hypothetical protein